ncbi:MAG: zf-TFIIB domain-containing protein [Phycisphaerae bacterium]|nr:zf-TFIIB domain-containing protein [Phycisphaerae bacterium]
MCPVCNEPMLAVELDGIEIDHCLACLGTWLDAGEVASIAERAGANPDEISGLLGHDQRISSAKSKRRCPRCTRQLRAIKLGQSPDHLTIDVCPRGHGEWFDQGEIFKLVSLAPSGVTGAVASFFAELFKSELESFKPKGA